MSTPLWFTLRLVGFGVLFVPAFSHLLTSFLPDFFAQILTALVCIVLAIFIDDLIFEENHGDRLLKALKRFWKSGNRL
ncbi:hypothetical protein V0288_17790 [Pannus brasiliensis CCIBt3594]|uniref:Uncharacterized protein n=1 Tax=Pannus brasiliensis CCIBt3594 TaxID=1427578 RepID=A0AAW9QXG5_9CHRO